MCYGSPISFKLLVKFKARLILEILYCHMLYNFSETLKKIYRKYLCKKILMSLCFFITEMVDSGVVTNCTNRTLQWVLEKGLCSSPTHLALSNLGYQRLTPIQLLALPLLLSKSNAFLHARTGSGKTLAFLIPTIERLKAMRFKTSHGK